MLISFDGHTELIRTTDICGMIRVISILGILLCTTGLFAQKADMYMSLADRAFELNNYQVAAERYEIAQGIRPTDKVSYNLGNVQWAIQDTIGAINYWHEASKSDSLKISSSAYHNLGNAFFAQQKIDKAIEAYKNALRIDPGAEDTRRNLAIVLAMQEQQHNNMQQQGEDGEQQEQQEQEKQEQESDKPQEQGQEDQESEQQESEQQEQEQQESSETPNPDSIPSLENMTKQELQRLLEVLEQEDKKVQQKAARLKTKAKKTDKEW